MYRVRIYIAMFGTSAPNVRRLWTSAFIVFKRVLLVLEVPCDCNIGALSVCHRNPCTNCRNIWVLGMCSVSPIAPRLVVLHMNYFYDGITAKVFFPFTLVMGSPSWTVGIRICMYMYIYIGRGQRPSWYQGLYRC